MRPARDSASTRSSSSKLTDQLRADGFLLASVDSFFWKKAERRAALFIGEKFRWAEIRTDSATRFWLRDARLDGLSKKALGPGGPAEVFQWRKLSNI